ncbi:MAG: hypothetical protein LH471_02890 [Salinibacterium sp.]|nr:hypothetical protein [Salinibacterium sp.]
MKIAISVPDRDFERLERIAARHRRILTRWASAAVVSELGPVGGEFLNPCPAGHVPGYVLSKIAAGIRLVTGI